MVNQDVKRKLTAILSADVEGYSRLMGEDEIATIRTLTAYRDAMTNLILLHRGRVVDAPGDNMLAEFASVVDAVQCAVEIQRELAERNAELPDKPSIVVLPFVNIGEDPEQDYFSDGITEEIITALSKISTLFVIASNTSFTYKGKQVKIQQVGRDLGVKYVLEGSVRKAGSHVRITAQLIDASTQHHLWAERFDGELNDIFALQDRITMKILIAMQLKLTEGEQARLYSKGTDNLEAYLKHLQGHQHARIFNKESTLLARRKFEEAIDLDPNYAMAFIYLAILDVLEVWLGSSQSPEKSLSNATERVQKAMSLDESLPEAHGVLGLICLSKKQHEKALAEVELAVAGNPNSADDMARLGLILFYAGKPHEGITSLNKAIRLNPIPPSWYWSNLGWAYSVTQQYEKAIDALNKSLQFSPDSINAWQGLALVYSLSGNKSKAHTAAETVLSIEPRFSIENFAEMLPFKNEADTDLVISALRSAGLN